MRKKKQKTLRQKKLREKSCAGKVAQKVAQKVVRILVEVDFGLGEMTVKGVICACVRECVR